MDEFGFQIPNLLSSELTFWNLSAMTNLITPVLTGKFDIKLQESQAVVVLTLSISNTMGFFYVALGDEDSTQPSVKQIRSGIDGR